MHYYNGYDTIDLSWQYYLIKTLRMHLQWGTQIVWTYGPLGFLDFYLPFVRNDITVFYVNIIFRIIMSTFIGFAFFNKKLKNLTDRNWFVFILLLLLNFVLTAHIELSMLLTLAGILINIKIFDNFEDYKKIVLFSFAGGIILAVASLIKFNILPLSIAVLFTTSGLCYYIARNMKPALISSASFLSGYFLTFLSLWIMTGQNTANIPVFLQRTYWIIKGYTPAMFLYGNAFSEITPVVAILYYVYIIIQIKDKTEKSKLSVLFIFLFLAYKEGYVRNLHIFTQSHIFVFYAVLSVTSLISYGIVKKKQPVLVLIPVLSVIFMLYSGHINQKLMQKDKAFQINSNNPDVILKKFYNLNPEIIKTIEDKPVDILPWDLLMAEVYHFNLQALPVPQLYQAYTHKLDEIDAHALYRQNTPFVIYTYEDVDHRYPLFSAPDTYRVLLSCYKTAIPDNTFSLLERKKCMLGKDTFVIKKKTRLEKWITIPANASFMSIDIRFTLLGKLLNILYKPSTPLFIVFRTDDNKTYTYRVIPAVLKGKLYVKYLIKNQNDFDNLLDENTDNLEKIVSFKIIHKRINLSYEKSYTVKFYR